MRTELQAMESIAKILEELPDDLARSRVVTWVINALKITPEGTAKTPKAFAPVTEFREPTGNSALNEAYSTFAEFFHAAAPKTDKDKALLAAHWTTTMSGKSDFGSQQLNTDLKNLGYGVSNITDALSQLMDERPSFVIQLSKSGSSKQARKTYKVTDAGVRRVKEMLNSNQEISQ